MASSPQTSASPAPGAGFLLDSPAAVFTPEDYSEEHLQIRSQTMRFLDEEIVPRIERLEQQDQKLSRELISKCGELGLLGVIVPEKYDGMELDLTSQLLVAESMGRYASFSTTYGAHSGIGTLPLVFFGSEALKQEYLPKMVAGETLAAYALSEPEAGSDALAARTRATLSEDGETYTLNGQKMWISNGSWADVFTVFAKVDGEKFTAFLVDGNSDGLRTGAEERKMGIHGSSTTAVYLDNVRVPAANILGEIGRGHIIAFNILNVGRLKLAASCVGGMREVLKASAEYAKQRRAFGQPIAQFGAIREKIARGETLHYAAESIVARIGGAIDSRLEGLDWETPDASATVLKAIEEYAVECSIAKVFATEALDYVVDEGVQIHGGYGFHQDYAVERAYRDSRINRIFEGANEINRLLSVGMILKRAGQGRLPLLEAVTTLTARLKAGDFHVTEPSDALGPATARLTRCKEIALLSLGLAYQRFGSEIDKQQEVNMALADIVTETFALESALLRTQRLVESGRGERETALTLALAADGFRKVTAAVESLLPTCVEGPKLGEYYGVLRRLTRLAPIDVIAQRRLIVEKVL